MRKGSLRKLIGDKLPRSHPRQLQDAIHALLPGRSRVALLAQVHELAFDAPLREGLCIEVHSPFVGGMLRHADSMRRIPFPQLLLGAHNAQPATGTQLRGANQEAHGATEGGGAQRRYTSMAQAAREGRAVEGSILRGIAPLAVERIDARATRAELHLMAHGCPLAAHLLLLATHAESIAQRLPDTFLTQRHTTRPMLAIDRGHAAARLPGGTLEVQRQFLAWRSPVVDVESQFHIIHACGVGACRWRAADTMIHAANVRKRIRPAKHRARKTRFHSRQKKKNQNLPPFFAEIGVGRQNLPPVSSKNGENCEFRGRNRQKTEKTVFRGTPTGGKQRKLCFGAPRRAEIGKNRVSGHPDGQKTAKTVFRGTPTGRNWQKSRFPTLGKSKSPKNRVSQLWERQNHLKTAFPNLGKDKNQKIGRIACPIG